MNLLAIDPGYERLGIAVLKKEGQSLVYSDCFQTPKEVSFSKRLGMISDEIDRVIKKFKPEALAIENVFFNKNKKTIMRVSEVRGAIINLALSKSLEIHEFTPLQVKIAVTGHGRSDKKQVISMVKNLIKLGKEIKSDDEFDAIAIGLTFLASEEMRRRISQNE